MILPVMILPTPPHEASKGKGCWMGVEFITGNEKPET